MTLLRVLESIENAGREIRNRVVRTAHAKGIGRGRMSDDLIAWHWAPACGGCAGMILVTAPGIPLEILH